MDRPIGTVAVTPARLRATTSYGTPDFVLHGYYQDRPFRCKDCGVGEMEPPGLESASLGVQAWPDKVWLHRSPTLEPCLMETLLILIASAAMLIALTLLVPDRAADDEER